MAEAVVGVESRTHASRLLSPVIFSYEFAGKTVDCVAEKEASVTRSYEISRLSFESAGKTPWAGSAAYNSASRPFDFVPVLRSALTGTYEIRTLS